MGGRGGRGVYFFSEPSENPIRQKLCQSGADPTTASYNASVVNFHNATESLPCFENKNVLFYSEKML
jgi:hypothetical protein